MAIVVKATTRRRASYQVVEDGRFVGRVVRFRVGDGWLWKVIGKSLAPGFAGFATHDEAVVELLRLRSND